jgi:large subunit ribosomal protein L30|tara:strand:+ start:253 stop:441 length:189 start_codon:yes stop_codon:yes gene_type:complete
MAVKSVKIKLVKSAAGRLKKHKACVSGLGLRRIGDEVEVEDTASVRGMINKIDYLIKVDGAD